MLKQKYMAPIQKVLLWTYFVSALFNFCNNESSYLVQILRTAIFRRFLKKSSGYTVHCRTALNLINCHIEYQPIEQRFYGSSNPLTDSNVRLTPDYFETFVLVVANKTGFSSMKLHFIGRLEANLQWDTSRVDLLPVTWEVYQQKKILNEDPDFISSEDLFTYACATNIKGHRIDCIPAVELKYGNFQQKYWIVLP